MAPKLSLPAVARVTNLPDLVQRFHQLFNPDAGYFSPGDPIAPPSPEPQPRQTQIQVGANLTLTPRSGDASGALLPFDQLRFFARNYHGVALAVRTRIRQMQGLAWDVTLRDPDDADAKPDPKRVKACKLLLERPDRDNDWQTWLAMVLRDALEIDAASVYLERTRGGGVYAMRPIDGSTIKPLIDPRGLVPDPPAPGYQQILWGRPSGMWSKYDLLYRPRNKRTDSMYGTSETEDVLLTVNLALRKIQMDLAHFTDGNIPAGLLGVPQEWTAEQIATYQQFFDSFMAGNLQARSRLIMAPGGRSGTVGVHEFAQFSGDPVFDEFLLKLTWAAFGTNSAEMGFTDDVNRSSGDSQQDVTYRNGIRPLAQWVTSLVNDAFDRGGYPELGFKFTTLEAEDELTKAQVHQTYFTMGALDADEIRQDIGKNPRGKPFIPGTVNPLMVDDIGKIPAGMEMGPDGKPRPPLNPNDPTDKRIPKPDDDDTRDNDDADDDGDKPSGDDSGGGHTFNLGDNASVNFGEAEKALGEPDPAAIAEIEKALAGVKARYHLARDEVRARRTTVLKALAAGHPPKGFAYRSVAPALAANIEKSIDGLGRVAATQRPSEARLIFEGALTALGGLEGHERGLLEKRLAAAREVHESAPECTDHPTVEHFAKALGFASLFEGFFAVNLPTRQEPILAVEKAAAPNGPTQAPQGTSHANNPPNHAAGGTNQHGSAPASGHWVTIQQHHVFIDAGGDFHFGGPSSPGISPHDPNFRQHVAAALAGHSGTTTAQMPKSVHANAHTAMHQLISGQNGTHVDMYLGGNGWRLELKDHTGAILATQRVNTMKKAPAVQAANDMLVAHHAALLQQASAAHVKSVQQSQQLAAANRQQSPSSNTPTSQQLTSYFQGLTYSTVSGRSNTYKLADPKTGEGVVLRVSGNGWVLQAHDAQGNPIGQAHRIPANGGGGAHYAKQVAAMMLYSHQHGAAITLPTAITGGAAAAQVAAAHQHAGLTPGGINAPMAPSGIASVTATTPPSVPAQQTVSLGVLQGQPAVIAIDPARIRIKTIVNSTSRKGATVTNKDGTTHTHRDALPHEVQTHTGDPGYAPVTGSGVPKLWDGPARTQ